LSKIQSLPTDLVHLIAAGEVIDSLAAAVRELIDNALDARASRLTITVWPESWQVQVGDNGSGLSRFDLEQAAQPHSTSKIHHLSDLQQIQTLGFRGEALHSLAQLGQLEICSRPETQLEGWRVVYSPQGQVEQIEPMVMAAGTIVTVRELFAAWPARRQALPTTSQQLKAIQWVIYQAALCHPQVTWRVQKEVRDGRGQTAEGGVGRWFNIAGANGAQAILEQILAKVRPGDLESGRQASSEIVLGLPDRCHRQRPDWVYLAVNGRCVQVEGEPSHTRLLAPLSPVQQMRQVSGLIPTLLQAFQQTLPRHRYPVCFVHLQVPPEQIDWNRHPAKTEIYLQNLDHWSAYLTQAVQEILGITHPHSPAATTLIKAAEAQGLYQLTPRQIQTNAPTLTLAAGEAELSLDATTAELELSLDPDASPSITAQFAAELLSAQLPSEPHLLTLKAVGQIHNTYIIAEHPAGIWLVEQHIAHERVLYEQLLTHWELTELTPPILLDHLSPGQVEQLQQLGVAIEPFGQQLWSVRSAPALLAKREDCAAALQELSQGQNLQAAIVATACRSAIRNGTPLDLAAMQTLLEQWQATRQPRTCPHGRPIYLPLAETSLARFFRRHWVIGKSHGI
jgi:DNA mismatch repair protein MutL